MAGLSLTSTGLLKAVVFFLWFVMYVTSLASESWVRGDGRNWGLWKWCRYEVNGSQGRECHDINSGDSPVYYEMVRALAVLSPIFFLLSLCYGKYMLLTESNKRLGAKLCIIFFPAALTLGLALLLLGLLYKGDERWKDSNPGLGWPYWLACALSILDVSVSCWLCIEIRRAEKQRRSRMAPRGTSISPPQRRLSNASSFSIDSKKKMTIFHINEFSLDSTDGAPCPQHPILFALSPEEASHLPPSSPPLHKCTMQSMPRHCGTYPSSGRCGMSMQTQFYKSTVPGDSSPAAIPRVHQLCHCQSPDDSSTSETAALTHSRGVALGFACCVERQSSPQSNSSAGRCELHGPESLSDRQSWDSPAFSVGLSLTPSRPAITLACEDTPGTDNLRMRQLGEHPVYITVTESGDLRVHFSEGPSETTGREAEPTHVLSDSATEHSSSKSFYI